MLVVMQVLALVVLILGLVAETAETVVALVITTQATTGPVAVAAQAGTLAMVVKEPHLIAQQPLVAQVLAVEVAEPLLVTVQLVDMAVVA
jgi:hypothetical protein